MPRWLVAGLVLTALVQPGGAIDSDNETISVVANIESTIEVNIVETIDCGEISGFPVTSCVPNADRNGTEVIVTSSGSNAATIAISGPAEMIGSDGSFFVQIDPFSNAAGTTAIVGNYPLNASGSTSFYLWPTAITSFEVSLPSGPYFGETTLTVSTVP